MMGDVALIVINEISWGFFSADAQNKSAKMPYFTFQMLICEI